MYKRLSLLLLLAPAAFGQSPVQPITITGNIVDAGGNPATSGTVTFSLQPQSSGIHYYVPGQVAVAPQQVVCNIQPDGSLQNSPASGPCTVWGNDLIAPANTTYTVIFAPNGQQSNSVPQECLTGAGPYNLNNPTFCPVVSIVPQYSSITSPPINGNLTPTATNLFTIGNAQGFYLNAFLNNLTFPASWNGLLLATNGIVTAAAGGLPGGPYLPLAGGTMSGPLNVVATTPSGQNAISFNYLAANYLPLIGGTLTGTLRGTNAVFSSTMNASSYLVNSVPLSAANLSNGTSGTGAVCLASGSACAVSSVSSVGLTSSNTNLISVAGSPVTPPGGTLAMTVNALGTDTKLVTGTTSGTSGTPALWDANGGVGPVSATYIDEFFTISSTCTPPTSTDSNCTGTGTLITTMPNTSYQVLLTVFNSAGAFLYAVVTAQTTTQFSYTITCTFNCATISTPSMFVHAHHT